MHSPPLSQWIRLISSGLKVFVQALATVEIALDGNGRHVSAQGGELALLPWGDFSVGEEDDDSHSRMAQERLSHRTSRIPRCGGEDREGLLPSFPEVRQEASHEACSHVLEREGRSVEELQDMDPIFQWNEGDRKVQGFLYQGVEGHWVHGRG